MTAYFIMGRSSNSRNRIFVEDGEGSEPGIRSVQAGGPQPDHLRPRAGAGQQTIVTNGDQTDTIYEGMDHQMTFEQSLRSRCFEPDAPNYTPRISGILHLEGGSCNYAMSILKSDGGDPSGCQRFTFAYENPKAGEGRFIHTYQGDGNPLPSFEGEPELVGIEGDIESLRKRCGTA